MDTPDWLPDELRHAGHEHLDPTYVLGYDDKAGTNPADDLALLRELGLNETHTLVDLGAGTGALALAAAPHCRRVVAVDVSPVMLTFLREKAARQEVGNLECVRAGFLTYQHQGDPADFVYSRHALHHLPDFWKAIAIERIAATLRIGGVFHLRDLVFSCEPSETGEVVEGWLATASEQPGRGWTRPELETHLREEYSTFTWLLVPMIERAGFEILNCQHADSRVYSTYICVRRR
ncbi:MAG TPA: class I SAM-dependent methyltransferase [Ardenticatenaceae bacterium]|nr:class I SAM-dependent methyltransferase [Ardenticatenaceae bacterium]